MTRIKACTQANVSTEVSWNMLLTVVHNITYIGTLSVHVILQITEPEWRLAPTMSAHHPSMMLCMSIGSTAYTPCL